MLDVHACDVVRKKKDFVRVKFSAVLRREAGSRDVIHYVHDEVPGSNEGIQNVHALRVERPYTVLVAAAPASTLVVAGLHHGRVSARRYAPPAELIASARVLLHAPDSDSEIYQRVGREGPTRGALPDAGSC